MMLFLGDFSEQGLHFSLPLRGGAGTVWAFAIQELELKPQGALRRCHALLPDVSCGL